VVALTTLLRGSVGPRRRALVDDTCGIYLMLFYIIITLLWCRKYSHQWSDLGYMNICMHMGFHLCLTLPRPEGTTRAIKQRRHQIMVGFDGAPSVWGVEL
jgi:hypothetical protein